MKLKKKTAMVASFAVGVMMFTTTVMAEVVSKSGYVQAKDAIKYSAECFSGKLSNYTIDMSMAVKDNGKVIISENTLSKCDNVKGSQENVNISINGKDKKRNFYYRDKNGMITNDVQTGIYYETKFEVPDSGYKVENPFKREEAADIEKIGDALIGNLKDYVVVEDKSNGTKELSGSVSETQIPTLINAVSSYMLKTNIASANKGSYTEVDMPLITKDIYIKEIKGKMVVDKNGLIQNIFGSGTFYGKDDKGKEHNLTFELLFKVSNVNSTVVSKPDLTGKKVEKSVQSNRDQLVNPEKYIGKYKNDIVIESNGKFKKIGERILNINHFDNKIISGSYEEKYLKGYESYAGKITQIKFDAKFDNDSYHNATFKVEALKGTGSIDVDRHGSTVYLNLPQRSHSKVLEDGNFNRIFE